jgi:hypothetical protein
VREYRRAERVRFGKGEAKRFRNDEVQAERAQGAAHLGMHARLRLRTEKLDAGTAAVAAAAVARVADHQAHIRHRPLECAEGIEGEIEPLVG